MTEALFSDMPSGHASSETIARNVMHKTYFYHDVRVVCQTNHVGLLAILEGIPGMSSTPVKVRGAIVYSLFCYKNAADFPVSLPRERYRIEVLQLVTNTTVKYYKGADNALYQSFLAQPPLHGNALTVLYPNQCEALTQVEFADVDEANEGDVRREHEGEQSKRATQAFLRRYIILLALGELLRTYRFEPCHAAAITAPWDDQQGALLLGDSGSGKTTTSLGCALAGCGLLGDDLLLLRQETDDHDQARSRIRAYAIFPDISVRSPSLDFWSELAFLKSYPADQRDKRFCTPEMLRPGAGRLAAPIQLLLFPTLTHEPVSRLLPLNKAATLGELVRLCISKEHGTTRPELQQRQFQLMATLAEQTQGYRLLIARGDHDCAQLVCTLFKGAADV